MMRQSECKDRIELLAFLRLGISQCRRLGRRLSEEPASAEEAHRLLARLDLISSELDLYDARQGQHMHRYGDERWPAPFTIWQ
jgi:hypothetical protein